MFAGKKALHQARTESALIAGIDDTKKDARVMFFEYESYFSKVLSLWALHFRVLAYVQLLVTCGVRREKVYCVSTFAAIVYKMY